MKQYIIAIFILLSSISGCANTTLIRSVPDVVTSIPLGVEIRSDTPIIYLICGMEVAMSIHTASGTQVFRGAYISEKLKKMIEINGDVKVIRTELTDTWDDVEILCDTTNAPGAIPEQDHLFIEDMLDRGKMWSADYQS